MNEVHIPDQIYQQAAKAAKLQNLSLDKYVAKVLRLHFREEDEAIQRMFTPDRLAIIAEAVAEMDAGLGIPFDQWRKDFEAKRAAFLESRNA